MPIAGGLVSSPPYRGQQSQPATKMVSGKVAPMNQIYGIAADVLRGRQTGNVMGIVSLGAGVCGYLGPQMLGALRDWTGGFAAGWYMMAAIAAISVAEFAVLGKYSQSERQPRKLILAGPTS